MNSRFLNFLYLFLVVSLSGNGCLKKESTEAKLYDAEIYSVPVTDSIREVTFNVKFKGFGITEIENKYKMELELVVEIFRENGTMTGFRAQSKINEEYKEKPHEYVTLEAACEINIPGKYKAIYFLKDKITQIEVKLDKEFVVK